MKTEQELDQLMAECFKEIQPSQIGDEFRRLLSLLNRLDIKNVLEIGTEEGGTLKVWTKMFPEADFLCIDANTYNAVQGKQQQLEAKWRSWLTPLQRLGVIWSDSHAAGIRDILMGESGKGFDLVFIDGDHSESGVEQDYLVCKDFVRPGGVIVFCDIHVYPGRDDMQVHKFWERFTKAPVPQTVDREYHPGARPNFIEIYHDKGNQKGFGQGVLFV